MGDNRILELFRKKAREAGYSVYEGHRGRREDRLFPYVVVNNLRESVEVKLTLGIAVKTDPQENYFIVYPG